MRWEKNQEWNILRHEDIELPFLDLTEETLLHETRRSIKKFLLGDAIKESGRRKDFQGTIFRQPYTEPAITLANYMRKKTNKNQHLDKLIASSSTFGPSELAVILSFSREQETD